MRHVSVVLMFCLSACSMIGGAKLGGGTASPAGGAELGPTAGSQYTAATAVPKNLNSAMQRTEMINEYLDKMEQQLQAGTLSNPEDIHYVRITFLAYHGELVRGGSPPCKACKNNPKWKEMAAGLEQINARFAALETAVASCTYGYRMTNGDLLPLNAMWTEEEWAELQAKALPVGYAQKERCWLDDKAGKAGKAQSWAY